MRTVPEQAALAKDTQPAQQPEEDSAAASGTSKQPLGWPPRHPLVPPLAVAGLGLAGVTYLLRNDPHDPTCRMVPCLWRLLTGFSCPSCGGTRMVYDLLHGDLRAAWRDNPALLLALPAVAAGYGQWLRTAARGERYQLPLGRRGSAVLVAASAVWTVARNVRERRARRRGR